MRSAILVVALILMFSVSLVAEASPSPDTCTCSRFVEHVLSCSALVWKNHADDHPATVDELERLLNKLREGDQEDLQKLQSSGCIGHRDEDCDEQCLGPEWERHARLLRESQDPAIHRGAITFLFKAYTDIEEPADLRPRLEKLARDVLGRPRDDTTTATVLLLMATHDIGTMDVIKLLLGDLDSADRLVRQLSYERLAEYTGTTLPFDSAGDATLRKEQATALRREMTEHPPRKRTLELPQIELLVSRTRSFVRDLTRGDIKESFALTLYSTRNLATLEQWSSAWSSPEDQGSWGTPGQPRLPGAEWFKNSASAFRTRGIDVDAAAVVPIASPGWNPKNGDDPDAAQLLWLHVGDNWYFYDPSLCDPIELRADESRKP